MESKLKIRIAYGSNTVIGPGKAQLLEAIKKLGSISKAANSMEMSYRRAWELVNVMNQSFKKPIVITMHGGSHGGGAQISELGELLLQSYRTMETKMTKAADRELSLIYSKLAEN